MKKYQTLFLEEKTYTIQWTRKGKDKETTGTLDELKKYFGYTFEVALSHGVKVNKNTKNINDFLKNLNKAEKVVTGNTYNPIFYYLKQND
jgi:hypothetical protein